MLISHFMLPSTSMYIGCFLPPFHFTCNHCQKFLQPRFTDVIGRAKGAPHWGVQSRFRVIYSYTVNPIMFSGPVILVRLAGQAFFVKIMGLKDKRL